MQNTLIQAKPDGGFVTAGSYDPATQTLTIEFKGEKTFTYADVDPADGNGFVASLQDEDQSAGKYFHANIKGKYEHTEI